MDNLREQDKKLLDTALEARLKCEKCKDKIIACVLEVLRLMSEPVVSAAVETKEVKQAVAKYEELEQFAFVTRSVGGMASAVGGVLQIFQNIDLQDHGSAANIAGTIVSSIATIVVQFIRKEKAISIDDRSAKISLRLEEVRSSLQAPLTTLNGLSALLGLNLLIVGKPECLSYIVEQVGVGSICLDLKGLSVPNLEIPPRSRPAQDSFLDRVSQVGSQVGRKAAGPITALVVGEVQQAREQHGQLGDAAVNATNAPAAAGDFSQQLGQRTDCKDEKNDGQLIRKGYLPLGNAVCITANAIFAIRNAYEELKVELNRVEKWNEDFKKYELAAEQIQKLSEDPALLAAKAVVATFLKDYNNKKPVAGSISPTTCSCPQ
mmetsp:Transcript_19310/g.33201  ORF Transcript_19310/g.33201 Transcript_19310/m.33201 type:complete len:377 (-) Transcript_19310:812-1942(-)|eukprot:CAMPEP_0196652870 /NCGR_PEP_ID=MMETSP1086-20130531/2331_1 /TAXON_ID=77921 /ORGANISM="Cyanoptyche  gloeocystis , Strain SAG4.97" /LENGTH=376 /DNA_ID=CAMNT_0041983685 /DNA_START=82 /DNA_END=1212 /DNA_ORIENTATION=+